MRSDVNGQCCEMPGEDLERERSLWEGGKLALWKKYGL